MQFNPHPYQHRAIERMVTNEGFALLLDPGLGKTSISLAALTVFKHHGTLESMLVIAPKRPMELTWPAEVKKWDSFKHLRVSLITGTPTQRLAAMKAKADVYVINPEMVAWLHTIIESTKSVWGVPPKMLVVDESTRFKNPGSQRFKALRQMIGSFERRYILSGTPAPQSVEDLFAQMQIVDKGERLGRFLTHFRKLYCIEELVRVAGGRQISVWHPKDDADMRIYQRISDVALRLTAEDYLTMPRLTVNDISVEIPVTARAAYRALEGQLVAKLDEGATLTAASAAAAVMKLRQITNGFAYTEGGISTPIHTAKLDALADLVEEQSGQPLLVAVAFVSEVEAIRAHLKIDAPYLGGGVSKTAADDIVRRWNAGTIPVLLVHPTSVAHGLNLQAGGHAVCWFGLTWNLEEYIQCNARVYRQGQEKPVVIHRIIAADTVDEGIAEALASKGDVQSAILNRLKG